MIDYATLRFVITPMQIDEIDEVLVIEREAYSLPWSVNAYRHDLTKNELAHYLVLRQQAGTTVGRASPPFWRKWLGARPPSARLTPPILAYGGFWLMVGEAHISTVAVRKIWRGRRLGELMLVGMIELALDLQAEVVTLEVRASNSVAQNLYRKYGFAQAGVRKRYYSDNGEDAYIMTTAPLREPAYQQRYATLKLQLWKQLQAGR